MMQRRTLLLAAGASTLLAACGGSDSDPSLLARVQNDPELGILAEAVAAAGLGGTLDGAGPFTLFAPTDAAFAALLSELGVSKDDLLGDVGLLTAVLSYHLLDSRVVAADVPVGLPVTTVQGGFFKPAKAVAGGLEIVDGRNRVAGIVATDVHADNGVLHKLDRVLLPADKNIVQTAIASAPEFSILVEAVVAAGLVDALSAPTPLLTVFAPTDAAFADLLTALGISKAELLANTTLLTTVLTYHVVPSLVLAAAVPLDTDITTLQGGSFQVDDTLTITDATGGRAAIVATDVLTSNGAIHVIDKVLLPA
ncbi:MAG: fasciclin domain-containing protein [Rubrivivax sp.]|nr:fasciclin domain-containing protein [Rubrivivax sp.]